MPDPKPITPPITAPHGPPILAPVDAPDIVAPSVLPNCSPLEAVNSLARWDVFKGIEFTHWFDNASLLDLSTGVAAKVFILCFILESLPIFALFIPALIIVPAEDKTSPNWPDLKNSSPPSSK